MADYAISSANLSAIESGLKAISRDLNTINGNIEVVDSHVDQVNSNVRIINDELSNLAREFRDFIQLQVRANAKSNAQQNLILHSLPYAPRQGLDRLRLIARGSIGSL